jgi:hypothetical protein
MPTVFRRLESYLCETAQGILCLQSDETSGRRMRTVDSPTELPSGLFVFFLPLPLLNAGATTLDQDDQHKNKKSAGSNSDNCRRVHCDSPFRVFGSILSHGAEFAGSTGSSMNNELLNLRAPALNQNDQHENKEHAGSNSDNCRSVHRVTPFPCLDPFLSHGAK